MAISAMTFEAFALDVEGNGKTVLSRFSLESLRLRICFSQCSIYCEEENLHFCVPLILPPRLPSLGSAENWQTFLGCCFGQFIERQGLRLFPKLSGGGSGCSCCEPVPKKEPPDPKPIVSRHLHFEALKVSSSDLNSRLIYAWDMYTEAQETGDELNAQRIITWILANGGSDKSDLLEQDIIKLTDLSIQAPSMRTLASTLRAMRKLRYITLQHANIDAVATQILCEGLKNSDLIVLNLQKNRIGPGGAQAIGSMKMSWVNLAILDLNDPTSDPIGPDGAKALFETPAKHQNLLDNYPAEKSYLDSLERICVGGHKITDEGVEYVVRAFEIMKKLETLFLYDNGITDQGAGVILDNIRVAVNLTGISTQDNVISSATEAELQQTLAEWVCSRPVKADSEQPVDIRMQQMKSEAVVLRTLPNQPPGVEQICIQGDVQKFIAVLEGEVMLFNVATSQWQQLCALRREINVDSSTSSTFIAPTTIFACGGGDRPCTCHVGNLAYMLQADNGSVQELPHMSARRCWPGVAWDSERKALYVFGGNNCCGTCYTVDLRTSEMFLSNQWSPLADMHQGRSWFNPCWHSCLVYLCGGWSTNSVEAYDPRSNTFALQDFTLPEVHSTTAVVECGVLTVVSYRYISKLQQGKLTSQEHERYDVWSNCTPLVSEGAVYVVSLCYNCSRCIDLTTGAVRKRVSLS